MYGKLCLFTIIACVILLSSVQVEARKLWMDNNPIRNLNLDRFQSARDFSEADSLQLIARSLRNGDDNDASDVNNAASPSSNNGKGVQIMITKKMRRILIDELNYYESEVDDMEPQIAAVLIDRRLSRPKKGVPASWLKPSAKKQQWSNHVANVFQHLGETGMGIVSFGRTYVAPLLPYAVLGSILFLQRGLILHVAGASLQSVRDMKTHVVKSFEGSSDNNSGRDDTVIDRGERDEGVTPRRFGGTIRVPTTKDSSSIANKHRKENSNNNNNNKNNNNGRVNLRTYDQAGKRSWWDNWVVQSSGWRRKNGI